jgi:hypothetical protein
VTWAEIALSFVNALVWPAVALTVLTLYRRNVIAILTAFAMNIEKAESLNLEMQRNSFNAKLSTISTTALTRLPALESVLADSSLIASPSERIAIAWDKFTSALYRIGYQSVDPNVRTSPAGIALLLRVDDKISSESFEGVKIVEDLHEQILRNPHLDLDEIAVGNFEKLVEATVLSLER